MRETDRIPSLDGLRGLAALAVLFFHFVYTSGATPAGVLKSLAEHGWLGVHVFFVISGLVIPHSLSRAGYRVSDYLAFICKRVARLEPPYLASILVVVLVWWGCQISPGLAGPSPFADPKGLLLHLGYLNAFFDRRWINPVYWTLAIEFQYYILIGLIYPLLSHPRRPPRLITMCLLGSGVFLVPGDQFVFKHLPYFFVGVALFQHRGGLVSGGECAVTVAALLVLAAFTLSPQAAAAALAAALCIRFADLGQRVLVFCGDISYSLYLLHMPVGATAQRACTSFGLWWPVGVLAAFAASIFAAWLMRLTVERLSRRLASRIIYRREAEAGVPGRGDPARVVFRSRILGSIFASGAQR